MENISPKESAYAKISCSIAGITVILFWLGIILSLPDYVPSFVMLIFIFSLGLLNLIGIILSHKADKRDSKSQMYAAYGLTLNLFLFVWFMFIGFLGLGFSG